MLYIHDLHKRFGGVHALRGTTTTIPDNAITAIIGPNGAGKTTLFDAISGLIHPDNGSIIFNETPLHRKRPDQIANVGIGRTFQKPRLFTYLTIADHLHMAKDNLDMNLFANVMHPETPDPEQHKPHLDEFGIEMPLDTPVSELSYGQRKLLEMAMVFLKLHHVALLDEPVAGVNQQMEHHIESVLLHLKAKGEAITIIEHDMEFVRHVADKVIVMNEGSVLAEGTPHEVFSDPRVIEAYLGT